MNQIASYLKKVAKEYGKELKTLKGFQAYLDNNIQFEYRLIHEDGKFYIEDFWFAMWEPAEKVLDIIKAKGCLTYDDMTSDLATYDFNK